jgi:putative aldouronate transport system permease protein
MVAETQDRAAAIAAYEKPGKGKLLLQRIWRERYMYALILPGLCYYLLFVYLPLLGNVIAFQDYKPFVASLEGPIKGFLVGPWVGLENFQRMWDDPDFLNALKNTVQIELLQLIFAFPAPLGLALLLNSMISERTKRAMQTIVYLPYFLSWVIVIAIWQQVFGGTGIVNGVLSDLSLGQIDIMQNPDTFKLLVVVQAIWKECGWGTIIFLAALTKVDISLYEAAVIDGASGWRRLLDVTLPAIRGIIVLLLILRLGGMFTVGFEQYYLQRQAVGAEVSEVLDTFVYYRGVGSGDWSFATAVGMMRSAVGLLLILGANWLARRLGEEGVL